MIKSKLSVLVAAFLMVVAFSFPTYAAEYKNAEMGFSVTYPDALVAQKAPTKATVLFAITGAKMPWITASIVEGATFQDAVKASFGGASDYSNIGLQTAKDVATDSGIKALAAPIKYMYQETYECEGIILGAQKNGKWILVAYATVPMYDTSYNPDEYTKILKTLKFN